MIISLLKQTLLIQEIEMELHCIKGIGDAHAKWSPVGMVSAIPELKVPSTLTSHVFLATATYRLRPRIILHQPIPSHLAEKFMKCFSPGVINVKHNKKTGQKEVIIADERRETMSREVLRHKEFDGMVSLNRVRDFFMCTSVL